MEHHLGDFSLTVRDIRHFSPPENDGLTLLWLLEGSATLQLGESSQPMRVDELAIINRRQRWQITGEEANAVMILNLAAGWLTRLDSDFFASDYRVSSETRDATDNLRQLMRQLLVARAGQSSVALSAGGQPLAE